jgi:hypothetical protein
MGLDICIIAIEEFADSASGNVLGLINVLATAIITLAGISLGIFVGEHGTLGLHDGFGNKVLGSDEFDFRVLAGLLLSYDIEDFRITF